MVPADGEISATCGLFHLFPALQSRSWPFRGFVEFKEKKSLYWKLDTIVLAPNK